MKDFLSQFIKSGEHCRVKVSFLAEDTAMACRDPSPSKESINRPSSGAEPRLSSTPIPCVF